MAVQVRFWLSNYSPEEVCDTFEEVRRIEVRDGDFFVGHLNELEYIRGEVFANVWLTGLVARTDPDAGQVTHRFPDNLPEGAELASVRGISASSDSPVSHPRRPPTVRDAPADVQG